MTDDEQRKYALVLFRGSKYVKLRKAIKDGKCFRKLIPIAEKAGAIEHWDEFIDEWKYRVSFKWPAVTDEMKLKAFKKMKNEKWIYYADRYWSGITNDMRIKAFKKMKNEEWIYYAGCYWTGISNEIKIKALKKMKDEKWIHYAGCDWFYYQRKEDIWTMINREDML